LLKRCIKKGKKCIFKQFTKTGYEYRYYHGAPFPQLNGNLNPRTMNGGAGGDTVEEEGIFEEATFTWLRPIYCFFNNITLSRVGNGKNIHDRLLAKAVARAVARDTTEGLIDNSTDSSRIWRRSARIQGATQFYYTDEYSNNGLTQEGLETLNGVNTTAVGIGASVLSARQYVAQPEQLLDRINYIDGSIFIFLIIYLIITGIRRFTGGNKDDKPTESADLTIYLDYYKECLSSEYDNLIETLTSFLKSPEVNISGKSIACPEEIIKYIKCDYVAKIIDYGKSHINANIQEMNEKISFSYDTSKSFYKKG
jgi:hypothetical protein